MEGGRSYGAQRERFGTIVDQALPSLGVPVISSSKRRLSLAEEDDWSAKNKRISGSLRGFEYEENMSVSQRKPAKIRSSTPTAPEHPQQVVSREIVFCAGRCIEPQSANTHECPEIITLDETARAVRNNLIPAPDYIALEDSGEEDEFGISAEKGGYDDNTLDESSVTIHSIVYEQQVPPLCQEQIDLVELILKGNNVFYTGSAGCGKSTVLGCFVKCLKVLDKRVYIVAPTGRAALDVGGSTFWSYAGWTPDMMKRPMKELYMFARKKQIAKRLKDTDVLVIDEISMMENEHFERLNRIMKSVRDDRRAFGGVQIIVTGDFCQLPPVKPFEYCMECGKSLGRVGPGERGCSDHGNVYEANMWAFCSEAWRACSFAHVNLTTIHRQKDMTFKTILERLRLGKPLRPKDRDLLLNHKANTKGGVKLFPKRLQVDRVNREEFDKLSTPILQFKCLDYFSWNKNHIHLGSKGKRNHDESLAALNEHRYGSHISLRVGMLVVLLVNLDVNRGDWGLVNGSQGTVVGFEKYEKERLSEPKGEYKGLKTTLINEFVEAAEEKEWPVVKFTNGRQEIIYPDCKISDLGDKEPYSLLSRTQLPLMAAWAMTVHKAQGMTLSRVVVDLAESFEEGHDYVALSRARGLEGLKVERLAKRDRSANPEVKRFLREKFGVE